MVHGSFLRYRLQIVSAVRKAYGRQVRSLYSDLRNPYLGFVMEKATPPPARYQFTIDEYYQMGDMGIFKDTRVELIEGTIIDMTPINSIHASLVDKLANWLSSLHAGQVIVRSQNPLRLSSTSEPEPDITILDFVPDFYASVHPGPGHTQLVIEVSDTSLAYDRETKGSLYARYELSEYWIINIPDKQLECYTKPRHGTYQNKEIRKGQDAVSVQWLPDKTVARLFGLE